MTSHDIDEDVSKLDDDDLLALCCQSETADDEPRSGRRLPDWPEAAATLDRISIDADIATWFQSRSSSWDRDINAVLRAWIATRTA